MYVCYFEGFKMPKTPAKRQKEYRKRRKGDEDYKRQRAAVEKRYQDKKTMTENIHEAALRKVKDALRKQKSRLAMKKKAKRASAFARSFPVSCRKSFQKGRQEHAKITEETVCCCKKTGEKV